MSEEMRFTVICVDGDAADLGDFSTPSLRYNNLNWEDSVTLARLAFDQGFEVLIWKIDTGNGEEGGSGECAET